MMTPENIEFYSNTSSPKILTDEEWEEIRERVKSLQEKIAGINDTKEIIHIITAKPDQTEK